MAAGSDVLTQLPAWTMAGCAGLAGGLAVAGDPGARRARALMARQEEERWGPAARATARAFFDRRREWLCAPVAVLLAAVGESVLPLLACAVAVPLVRRWLWRRARRQECQKATDAVTALCGAVVGELRAGREPGLALLAAARNTGALGAAEPAVLAAARFGGDVPGALRQASAGPGLDGLAGVAACWRVAVDGGAGLAAGLARLESSLRDERRWREGLRAQLAGAWATVVVLALLPVVGLGLGAALGADPLGVLLHSPGGLVCLVTGGLLEAAGLFWASRIVRTGEAE
ncbi:MAG TPA: type II secretion protein F [Streptomyces sp.]|uniref:type II secretion system F family protein n=1 Tax=Streptomyces sp. TaxID=1931 RepID=UPI002CEE9C94|nr:type II secretion protein F [Streptomyces sp.]HWU06843.1 type II secretion protein F [Streptomyces sp.]